MRNSASSRGHEVNCMYDSYSTNECLPIVQREELLLGVTDGCAGLSMRGLVHSHICTSNTNIQDFIL